MSKLFNPIKETQRSIINGETSGMMILSDNVYKWSSQMYNLMMGNFWKPEELALTDDKLQYPLLSDVERLAFDRTIAFLIFLDSLQTKNLPNISDVITLPEINLLITIQGYQEAIHSQSYGYILESVIPAEHRRNIYDIAVENPQLLKRNEYIANLYQDFIDNPQDTLAILKVCMANFILEGIYFYTGFAFFFNLAQQGKMTGTASVISYIQKDELSHLALFKNIIQAIAEYDVSTFSKNSEVLFKMVRDAVEQEKEWVTYAYSDVMSVAALHKYVEYVADKRLAMLGFGVIYGVSENPLPFVDRFQNPNGVKTDFFEEKVKNYAVSNVDLSELDELEF